MRRSFVVGALLALYAVIAAGACSSFAPDSASIGADAGPCGAADGSVTNAAAQLEAGLCAACVQAQCGAALSTCARDCVCNPLAAQALACVASLPLPTASGVTSCLTALGNSTDGPADQLSACLAPCVGACDAGAAADADAAADAASPADADEEGS
jgi:hypothetical protein